MPWMDDHCPRRFDLILLSNSVAYNNGCKNVLVRSGSAHEVEGTSTILLFPEELTVASHGTSPHPWPICTSQWFL